MKGKSVHFILMMSIATSFVLSGCATSRTAGWSSDVTAEKLSPEVERRILAEGKSLWTKRHEKASLQEALKKFEQVALSNPDHTEALTLLCRGYYLLADGHTDGVEEQKKIWEVGTSWGERALATNAAFRAEVTENRQKPEDAFDKLDRKHVDAIYWTAVNLGKWAKNSGIATVLKYKPRITKMITRVEQLDPHYYYGAIDRYWAVYYAVAPFFAGGSLEKSYESFQKTFKTQKNYLGSHVLYAENYATRKGDRDLFKKTLQFVMSADPGSLPDVKPEQILEQRKAKKMLEKMEDYF